MYNTKFYKYFWLFIFGSTFGVFSETVWRIMTKGTFDTRVGVIYGPFNPVYGLALVLITLCLVRFSEKSILFIVILATVVGGGFEYLASVVQEMIFGTTSWNYKKFPLNINGRTNIPYDLLWGLLGAIWIKIFYPSVKYLIEQIPRKSGVFLTYIMLIFMIINISLSSAAVYRGTQRAENIPAKNAFEIFLDKNYNDAFLYEKYPNMRHHS